MTVILRPYQQRLKQDVLASWRDGARDTIMYLATGGGKTAIMADLVNDHAGASCLIAHRSELVAQISGMLARYGIRHNIIAAEATKRAIAAAHVAEHGHSYYTPSARCAVASVDTLVRAEMPAAWASQVTLTIPDEGHHVVRGNKWHTALERFPNPARRGLLPTASPIRADGKGLGRHADGIADAMVEGPPMRWLIEQGFLTDYRVVCVESDLKLLEAQVGASGDWSPQQLREAAQKSHIVGDVVATYQKFARGLLNITFTTDTETAAAMTAAYRQAGVRAGCLTGKTHDGLRRQMLRQFSARELDVIVAVDIVSEGFDLPAIECVSFARPTQSLGLYMQQFGRALRPMPGKSRALILDHVGNVLRHLPPDRPRVWSLDRRDKRAKSSSDAIPMRVCLNCFQPFERIHRECPYCGHYHEPDGRGSPSQVEGDLAEMSADVLAALRGAVAQADRSLDDERWRLAQTGLPSLQVMAGVKHHAARLETQAALRDAMGHWGGRWHAAGDSDAMLQRRFFHTWGVDVLTAQTLKRAEAQALLDRIVNAG